MNLTMTDEIKALDELIEAVDACEDKITFKIPTYLRYLRHKIFFSSEGDLDTTKTLHDILVPGWKWVVSEDSAVLFKKQSDDGVQVSASADTPARAWLIAMLKAYRETLA